jgi:hypothetical protein
LKNRKRPVCRGRKLSPKRNNDWPLTTTHYSPTLPKPRTPGHRRQDADAAGLQNWEEFAEQGDFVARCPPIFRPYNRHTFAALFVRKSLRRKSTKPFAGKALRSLKRPLRSNRYPN